MATTEELLAQMEAEAQSETSVCVIDPETRTITVPPEYQLLGVENDKRVERLYFQCPKIVGDNQDLSQDYQLFINYQNANGDPDAYHINDMIVEDDNITFSWLLEENVTKYRGNIQFAFGAIKPGDEAEDPDKNRWNTTINTDCTCLIGLKCTQQVAESNPDALAQIWAAIDELKVGGGGGSGTPGKDGVGIDRIEKTNTQGLVDTYTIYLTDESTYTFTVTNGANGKDGSPGAKGDPGQDGITPTIGENGNWYLGDEDTGKPSRGEQGVPGQDGSDGAPGQTGSPGADGFSPTITENSGNTESVYKLDITTKTGSFTTPNLKGADGSGGSGPGTTDYTTLTNKPQLNGVMLEGNKSLDDIGVQPKGNYLTTETDPTVPSWAKNPTKPSYTATEVGADASGTAVAKVSEHNTAADAHSDIRLLVHGLTDRLNTLADSDDDTLDQMSEIVAYIKSNKTLIDGITTEKVNVTDIIDDLTTNVANKPLSAAQGVALKALIDGITIPETLPNPQKLIFSGATTGEYDGSSELTVNIPESSGGGSGLPLGGTEGQVLTKNSDDDLDVSWKNASISDEQIETAVSDYLGKHPLEHGEYVTPEMYGAVGDGITDDVSAFSQVIATGKPILLTQKYYVSASITFTQSVYSYTNAEIVHDAIVTFSGDGTLVSGVIFNGNNSSPYVHCTADNVCFFKCQFKNFSGNENYKQTFTLRLGEYNTVVHTGIVVDSCVFDGATSKYENGIEGDSQGVIRQIFIQNCSAKIVNCEFKNCIGKEDADIIHVQSVSELNSNYPYEKMSGICFTAVPCIIEGNTFHLSKCKSAIKIQCSDVIVQNNIILIEDEETIDGSRYAFRASVCNNVTISSNIVDIKDASSLKLSSVFMIEAMENIIIKGNLVYDNATGLGDIYDTTVLISRFTQTSIFSNNSILLRAIHNLLDVEYSTIVISGNKIECAGNYPDSILYIGKYYNHAVDGSDISEDVVLRFNGNEIIVTGSRSKIRVETSYAGSVDFSNNKIRGGIGSFEFQFNANAPTTFCRVCDIDIPLTFTTKSGSYLTTLESISIERCTIVYADLQNAVSCLIKDCDISSTYQAIYLTDVGKVEADGNYIHDITNRLFRIMTGNPVIEMKNNRFDDMSYNTLIESHYNNDSFQRNNITWHKDNKGAITGINTGTEPDSTMSYDLGFSFYKEPENKFVFSNGKGEWV